MSIAKRKVGPHDFPSRRRNQAKCILLYRGNGIFKEEYKNSQGRPPGEFEQQDFSKIGIIPFGILKQNGFPKTPQEHQQSNSSPIKNETKQASSEQSKNQPTQQRPVQLQGGWKSEVLRLLNEFPQP